MRENDKTAEMTKQDINESNHILAYVDHSNTLIEAGTDSPKHADSLLKSDSKKK